MNIFKKDVIIQEESMVYKKSEDTKQKIINVSKKKFMEKGFSNTGLREICRESGINHSLIYYYFPEGKYGVAQLLNGYHRKRCIFALREFYPPDGTILYLMTLLRFVWREIDQDEKELQFYNESWYDIQLSRPLVIEIHTAARLQHMNVDFDTIKKAVVIGDWSWNGLYAAKRKNSLIISDDEIRDTTDIVRWSYLGMGKSDILNLIQRSKEILKDIPICNIKIFEDSDTLISHHD